MIFTGPTGEKSEIFVEVNEKLPATMHGISEEGARIAGQLSLRVPTIDAAIEGVEVYLSHSGQDFEYVLTANDYPAPAIHNPVSSDILDEILAR